MWHRFCNDTVFSMIQYIMDTTKCRCVHDACLSLEMIGNLVNYDKETGMSIPVLSSMVVNSKVIKRLYKTPAFRSTMCDKHAKIYQGVLDVVDELKPRCDGIVDTIQPMRACDIVSQVLSRAANQSDDIKEVLSDIGDELVTVSNQRYTIYHMSFVSIPAIVSAVCNNTSTMVIGTEKPLYEYEAKFAHIVLEYLNKERYHEYRNIV